MQLNIYVLFDTMPIFSDYLLELLLFTIVHFMLAMVSSVVHIPLGNHPTLLARSYCVANTHAPSHSHPA